ncbi:MAG TPA: Rne/Rng family ribonuclease [Thermoanaerobaculia bacterium]|nr:Rne/Rng family ribonuclease [Thermoanaerobaculia bacterium]
MTRRLLIAGHLQQELRVAIVQDSTLEEYQFEVAEGGLTRGNIYRGTIASIEPSLNAAFIDYGAARHGFLACRDVVKEARYREPPKGQQPRIAEILERGKPIVVQVTRDPEGRKGAVLTTNLSLPGRYLVLMPFDDSRGVSRKVENEEERKALKALAADLDLPPGCGVVVRTNAREQNRRELNKDLQGLLRVWQRIQEEAMAGSGIRVLYSDEDLLLRVFRDYLDAKVDEILVDDDEIAHKAQGYLDSFMPKGKVAVKRYQERLPMFTRSGLEEQIERIYQRRVPLPSGGSVVIEQTEALTAIDVNSGSATQSGSQEETALRINLEAAAEVMRQLRLRDIGGLIVIDFIDMARPPYRKQVEKAVRDALKTDKARTRVARISANGLLEINRQRLRQPLAERQFMECPTCQGRGRIPNLDTACVQLLRRLEARAATGTMKSVVVRLHPQMADTFQNSRRRELAALEEEFGIRIDVKASPVLERLDEDVQWTSLSKDERAERREEAAVEAGAMTQPVALAAPGPAAKPRPARSAAAASKSAPARAASRRTPAAAATAGEDGGEEGAPDGGAGDAAEEGAPDGGAGTGTGASRSRRRRGGRSRRGRGGRKQAAAPTPSES